MVIAYCLQALYRSGGIERVITTKANYLASLGYEVHIVTTDQRDGAYAFPLDPKVQVHDLGLNYEHDNNLGRWGRIRALRKKLPRHKALLEDLFARIKPDVTIAAGFQAGEILPDLRDGSKKVFELHTSKYATVNMYPESQTLLRLYGRLRVWQMERLARRYDRFVILTEEERSLWQGIKSVVTIPNPRSYASDERANMSSKAIIAAGRFEYTKNFASLIEMWASIAKQYPDWTLDIYGDGPYKGHCQALVSRLGIEQQCVLHPATSEIRQRYLEHSVYAMCSHYEGLPMVLLEAQALGLPIVSYALPSGPRDIITDGKDGFLVRQYDREAFTKRLMEMMDSYDLREGMSVAAQESSERFSIDNIMARWIKLFDSLKD